MGLILDVELVVIRELRVKNELVGSTLLLLMPKTHLLAAIDLPLGEYNDAHIAIDLHDLRHTVGIARMVNVARQAAAQGGIHHAVLVQPEHVDAAVLQSQRRVRFKGNPFKGNRDPYLGLVLLLAYLGHLGAYDLAYVLDDHRVLLNVPGGIQAQTLDLGPAGNQRRLGMCSARSPTRSHLARYTLLRHSCFIFLYCELFEWTNCLLYGQATSPAMAAELAILWVLQLPAVRCVCGFRQTSS